MKSLNIDPPKRYAFIDALRGIAILGVIILHTHQSVKDLPSWLRTIANQGAMGVELFFIISAFTLFLSLAIRNEPNKTFNFFIRRFFRIAPLFFFGILLYLLIDGFRPRLWAPDGISWIHILLTALFLNGFHPTTITSVVPGGWSIAVEMNFYLLVPLLFSKIKKIHHALWGFFLSAAISIAIKYFISSWLIANSTFPRYLIGMFVNLWFPNHFPIFFLGFVIFFIFMNYHQNIKKPLVWSVCLYASIGLFFIVPFLCSGSNTFRLLILGVIIFFFVIAFIYKNKSIVNKPLCYVGKISFSCYILHFAVIKLIVIACRSLLPKLNLAPIATYILFFILTLFLTIIFGSLTYKCIEVPGMKLGRLIISKKDRKKN